MLIRWNEELAALDFEDRHRPGHLNTNADALSRREDEFMPSPMVQEEKEQTECINVIDPEEEELPMAVDEVEDGAPPGPVPRPNLDINLWLQSQ
ncbi:MAG: hypothetical protein GY696_32135 [Gammaproteobacteria bacterium]|nr:hypothetical protein [Gammaproteobacteria bacterium]